MAQPGVISSSSREKFTYNVKKAADVASVILSVYNDTMERLEKPLKRMNTAIRALRENGGQYSDKASVLVKGIHILLFDAWEECLKSQQEVKRWCQAAVLMLNTFTELCEYDSGAATAEILKKLLVKVLDQGKECMSAAIEKLENCRKRFNSARAELEELQTQTSGDFQRGSQYFDNAVAAVRRKAYGGAAAGIVLGPVGLAISYTIAAGIVEGNVVPALEKAFKEVEKQFSELQVVIEQADTGLTTAHSQITAEIAALEAISGHISHTRWVATEVWVIPSALGYPQLKQSIGQLKSLCQEYVDRELPEFREN